MTVAAVLVLCSCSPASKEPLLVDDSIEGRLSRLPVLPRVHYSWPIDDRTLSDELLFEYVRITGAYAVRGESQPPRTVAELVQKLARASKAIARVNELGQRPPATFAINYSVWHQVFPDDASPLLTGPEAQAELDLLEQNLITVRDELARLETEVGQALEVSTILFDSERFFVREGPDSEAWNAAIAEKHTAAYRVAKTVFPDARIDWYSRGCWRYIPASDSWYRTLHMTLDEPGDTFNCSIYNPPQIEETLEMLQRTSIEAAQHGIRSLSLWVALGSGYKPDSEGRRSWTFDWDYGTEVSWRIGQIVNQDHFWGERQGELIPNSTAFAAFYPEPFGRVPTWNEHFIAYVRGANGLPLEESP